MKYRLDKYCSNLGWFVRSEAKRFVKHGSFLVNGKKVVDASQKVFSGDVISYSYGDIGKTVVVKDFVYVVLNKPQRYISSDVDEHGWTSYRKLMLDYPYVNLLHVAGRLDQDTEGLMILSNDGHFIHQLIHPKKEIWKKYFVKTEKNITDEDCVLLEKGVSLEDGYVTLPCQCQKLSENELFISIREGKYHQVKRMISAIDNTLLFLKRVSIGGLSLDILGEKQWLEFEKHEIEDLLGKKMS